MGRRKKSSRSVSESEHRAKTPTKSPVYEADDCEDEDLQAITPEQARYIRSHPRIFTDIFQDNTAGYTIIHKVCREGDTQLLVDLLKLARGNCNKFSLETRDFESNYTALHDAISCGNISCAVKLLQFGASLESPANDGFSPLDIAVWNQYKNGFVPESHNLNVLTWGPNSNYNLGHSHDCTLKLPEKVKRFNRDKFTSSICNVNFGKFHTLFLDKAGFVYACGYGQGGRLGLGNEQTLLEPTLIPELKNIVKISCSNDHSLALSADGKIYSWGVNTHHVLGHPDAKNVLRPRVIKATSTFSKIVTVKAAKYHSVLVASDQIYTFGFNGGQLGHMHSDELYQIVPRSVTRLRHKPGDNLGKIAHVHASAAATLVGFESGAIFICNQYDVRKVANLNRYDTNVAKLDSMQGMLEGFAVKTKKIRVTGGSLARQVSKETNTKSTKPLLIAILDTDGMVFCCIPSMFKNVLIYHWNVYSEKFVVTDIALGSYALLLLTVNGEVFSCNPYPTLKSSKEIRRDQSLKSWSVGSHKQKEHIQMLKPIPLVRQAVLHNGAKIVCNGTGMVRACIIQDRISTLDFKPSVEDSTFVSDISALFDSDDVYDSDVVVCLESGREVKVHKAILANSSESLQNIVDKAHEDGRSCIDLKGADETMIAMLETVYFMHKLPPVSNKSKCPPLYNGMVDVSRCNKIDRERISGLADVTLISEDGSVIKCHRCVLSARVEYFKTHFLVNSRWGASNLNQEIPIDTDKRTLSDFVYYIYTDTFPRSYSFDSLKLLLKLSDQYLVSRLKSFCEVSMVDFITEENIMYVLRTAHDFNAHSLRDVCLYIVAMNVPYYLEHRILDTVEESILNLLDKVYKDVVLFHFMKPQYISYSVKDYLRDFANFDVCRTKSREGRKKSVPDPLENVFAMDVVNDDEISKKESVVKDITEAGIESIETEKVEHPVATQTDAGELQEESNVNQELQRDSTVNQESQISSNYRQAAKSTWGVASMPVAGTSLIQIIQEEKLVQLQSGKSKAVSHKKQTFRPVDMKGTSPLDPNKVPSTRDPAPKYPWGNTSATSSVVSLKDIMSSESPSKDTRKSPRERLPSMNEPASSSVKPVKSSPSQRGVSQTFDFSGDRQVHCLRSIMDDEQKSQAQVLPKTFSRPLENIQIEERAIQELRKLYKVDENFNEFITIQTVSNVESCAVKPAWGKKMSLGF